MHEVQKGLKRRAITQVLRQKIKSWLGTLPTDLAEKVEPHIIITGGCIASMLLGESVKDYDVYLDNPNVLLELAEYYVKEFTRAHPDTACDIEAQAYQGRVCIFVKGSGVASETDDGGYQFFEQTPPTNTESDDYIEQVMNLVDDTNKPKYRPVFLSENAISLSDKVQIVLRFVGTPEEIHKNYDFVHATNYFYENVLTLKPAALESLLSRALIYQGSLYPLCSMFRVRKFMERGWRISAGEVVKIALQLSKLNLEDPKILREQMIGVDAAYFYELLRMIQAYCKDNSKDNIDGSYVIQLIDELSDNPVYV